MEAKEKGGAEAVINKKMMLGVERRGEKRRERARQRQEKHQFASCAAGFRGAGGRIVYST